MSGGPAADPAGASVLSFDGVAARLLKFMLPPKELLDSLATLRILPLLLGFRFIGGCARDWVLFFGMIWVC